MRLILLLVGVSVGMALGALKWRGSAEYFHRRDRMAVILAQAEQMPKGGVLVIGDSITERVRMPFLCGRPALNAGIARSTSRDWLPDARKIIEAAKPSVVVLEIGVNDAGDFATEHAQLRKLATFEVPRPASTVDGVHPSPEGARQFIAAIEARCHATARSR